MSKSLWQIDKVHSRIEFSVRHMMITNVKGVFNEFDARIVADPEDLTKAEIEFTIYTRSIDTHKKERDAHLRSADFFNADKYPELKFKVTHIEKKSKNNYDVTGDLFMNGITKPITFNMTFEGQTFDSLSQEHVAGFTGESKINRHDFNLNWNKALESGGVLVGEEIKINLEIQLRKQSESKLTF